MPLCSWEETVTCPYNISHQITKKRLQHHLVKCRRNHPDAKVVVCPFNSCHHIHLLEKEDHIRTCQDRKFVEMTKYQLGLGDKKKIPFKPDRQKVEDEDEEDWEKEAIIKTSYDPRKKAIQLPVLRKLEGATPCQRREFRAQEKVRLNDLESGGMGRMMPAGLRKPQLDQGEVKDSSVGIQESRRGEPIGVEGGRRNRLVAVGRGAGGQARRPYRLSVMRGEEERGGLVHEGTAIGVMNEEISLPVDDVGVGCGRMGISKVGKGRGRIIWGR